jgi:hypothetical protein
MNSAEPKYCPKASPFAFGMMFAAAWPIADLAGPSGAHPHARHASRHGHRTLGGRGGTTANANPGGEVW